MQDDTLRLLRCPYCGMRLALVENDALVRVGRRIESGVLGCQCCAFPIVEGIPVLLADATTDRAMHALEAGRHAEALFTLLRLDDTRASAFHALLGRGSTATYRDALALLSPDAEGTYFLYRFSDPTYVVAEAIVRALAEERWTLSGTVLDLCGGSGHLTRVLSGLGPAGGVVLADLHFWKLWLARRYMAPECAPVCCDANHPLPFPRGSFSMVVLSDAFPYIWHKRLLADEMMRVAGAAGVIVMPHLHNADGENVSAGMTLTPSAYRVLFESAEPRLFSDERLLAGLLDRSVLDLASHVSPSDVGCEPSVTLVCSPRADLFREYRVDLAEDVTGELRVNPLYGVERRGDASVLTLTFPTPEYEEEFVACKRYLPPSLTEDCDLGGPLVASAFGPRYERLRRLRVLLDVPFRYF
jgi:uncharacterized protein YbaR (Trm112 family)